LWIALFRSDLNKYWVRVFVSICQILSTHKYCAQYLCVLSIWQILTNTRTQLWQILYRTQLWLWQIHCFFTVSISSSCEIFVGSRATNVCCLRWWLKKLVSCIFNNICFKFVCDFRGIQDYCYLLLTWMITKICFTYYLQCLSQVRARFSWDQGLHTYELYPSGIPSRHHYLRNRWNVCKSISICICMYWCICICIYIYIYICIYINI